MSTKIEEFFLWSFHVLLLKLLRKRNPQGQLLEKDSFVRHNLSGELFQVKMNVVHMDCKNASLFMD